jgi:hypothetical protein
MWAGLGFALEIFSGKGWKMNRLGGMKQKKRFIGCVLFVIFEKFKALFEEQHIYLFQTEVRSYHSDAIVLGVGMLWKRSSVQKLCGRNRNPVTVNECIEKIGSRTAGGSEEMVKAAVDWSIRDRARIIDSLNSLQPVFIYGPAILVHEGQADMPLAETCGCVTLLAKHRRKGQSRLLYQARPACSGEYPGKTRTESHTSGHHAVACRRADR